MLTSYLKIIIATLITSSILTFSIHAQADFKLPEIDAKFITMKEVNPTRDAGFMVGDILSRQITLTIQKPYELVEETLPIVGYEHRYKGQISGIELVQIKTDVTNHSNSVTHVIDLDYQVFTTSKLAKPAVLRAEYVKIRNLNTKDVVQYRIPAFSFRISPLSVFGAVKLKEEMSPFVSPLLLDNRHEQRKLYIALGVLAFSLLGLLYIFGMRAWLPKMGAPFARAYRDIKKLPDTKEGVKQGVARVHQSLNKTAGISLFGDNLNQFIAEKPQFSPAKHEIQRFFNLSRFTFFEDQSAPTLDTHSKTWLLSLCRHLRDCERGLKPNITTSGQG
jgi:mxaA protein